MSARNSARRRSIARAPLTGKSRARSPAPDASKLPLLRQFPIHNDRAQRRAGRRYCGGARPSRAAGGPAGTRGDEKYLTLNDLESYLWKFRRKTAGAALRAGGDGRQHHGLELPPEGRRGSRDWGKPQKPGLGVGGPKRSAKKKNKKRERQRFRLISVSVRLCTIVYYCDQTRSRSRSRASHALVSRARLTRLLLARSRVYFTHITARPRARPRRRCPRSTA